MNVYATEIKPVRTSNYSKNEFVHTESYESRRAWHAHNE